MPSLAFLVLYIWSREARRAMCGLAVMYAEHTYAGGRIRSCEGRTLRSSRHDDSAVHGFRVARSVYGSDEGGTPSNGAWRASDRSFRRRAHGQSQGLGLPVGGLWHLVC